MPLTSSIGTSGSALALSQILGIPPAPSADLNLSFEEDDGSSGATSWTVAVVASAFLVAPYGWPATEFGLRGEETFEEGWFGNENYILTWPSTALIGLFSGGVFPAPLRAESFEAGWGNYPYIVSPDAFLPATYHGGAAEGFELGWGADVFETQFFVDLRAAMYHVDQPAEAFELGWGADAFHVTWSSVSSTAATFNGQHASAAEGFVWVSLPSAYGLDNLGHFTCPDTVGVFSSYQIFFDINGAGQLPTGLSAGLAYYVVTASSSGGTTTFTISETPGGSTLVPTNNQRGANVFSMPREYWTSLMATI